MKISRCLLGILLFCSPFAVFAEEEPQWDLYTAPSAQDYHSALLDSLSSQDWWSVIDYALILSYRFPTTPFAQDSSFLMGEAYFCLNQYEYANEYLSEYLGQSLAPKYFEKAMEYKFAIAEQFAAGAKKHLFGSLKMPSWVSAEEDALKIYEEVIAALPYTETAGKALLHKARLQQKFEDYKGSLESLDALIRRFPKSELSVEAYLEKSRLYLLQSQSQALDPDLLDLAELNAKKFRLAFPRDPRLHEVQELYTQMEEAFAQDLLNTGRFFEKTKKKQAAQIYYQKIVSKYPQTRAAETARQWIVRLKPADA